MEERAFLDCAGVLPREIRGSVLSFAAGSGRTWEEIRLRAGRGVTLVSGEQETEVTAQGVSLPVTPALLRGTLELATNSSYQAAAEQLRRGFFTMRGGHRIGVTGSMTVRDGRAAAVRELSSLSIRVARAYPGIAAGLEGDLLEGGAFPGTLILSPPGMGKTTLLRELIRVLSDRYGLRISLADERGEVAALWKGVPQMDVGIHTDVLDGAPKAEGMMLLLRSMNPQLLAADEITAPEDVEAVAMAANCGVSVLATAHGQGLEELTRRPLYRQLLELRAFRRIIRITREPSGIRQYRMEALDR